MTTLPPVVQQFTVDLDCSRPREAARIIGNHLIALADALEPSPEPAEDTDSGAGECLTATGGAFAESVSSDSLNTYQVLVQRPGNLGSRVIETETVQASGYAERDNWVVFWGAAGTGRVAQFRADLVESVRLAQ